MKQLHASGENFEPAKQKKSKAWCPKAVTPGASAPGQMPHLFFSGRFKGFPKKKLVPTFTAAKNMVREDFLTFRTNGLPAIVTMPRRVVVWVVDTNLNFLTHDYPGIDSQKKRFYFTTGSTTN